MPRRRDVLFGAAALATGLGGCEAGATDQVPVLSLLPGQDPERVTTGLGVVEGRVRGDGVRVFRGVPYAAPPTGERRFRPPEPPAPWTDVLRATDFAPAPMQSRARLNGARGSEDCLYLNIWTPEAPGPHPVYVWIHAGGNEGGTTDDERYMGDSFARNNVVCVTITHRVGVWGFLELGDALGSEYAGSANNGLRDQLAALRWVQDHIADFGGDPGRVTVGGLSSGAKNICAFLACSEAEGLFQSAIVQSGGGQTVHTQREALDVADRFFNAPPMRNREPRELLEMSSNQVRNAQKGFLDGYARSFAFRAVVGGEFLPERPIDSIAAGSGSDVRMLIGGAKEEGALFLGARRGTEEFTQRELAHMTIEDAERARDAYRELHPDLSALHLRVRFVSFEEYRTPTQRVADARAAQPDGAETYLYRVDWQPRGGRFEGWAHHGVEAPFAWNTFDAQDIGRIRGGSAMRRMHDMWVRFIHGEAPEVSDGPTWPVYAGDDRRLMVFDDTLGIDAPDDREIEFWRDWM